MCTNLGSTFACSSQHPFVCGRPPHFSTCLRCEHRSIRNLYQIGSGFRSLIKVCEYLVRTQNGHVATSATQPNSRRKKFNKRVASYLNDFFKNLNVGKIAPNSPGVFLKLPVVTLFIYIVYLLCDLCYCTYGVTHTHACILTRTRACTHTHTHTNARTRLSGGMLKEYTAYQTIRHIHAHAYTHTYK